MSQPWLKITHDGQQWIVFDKADTTNKPPLFAADTFDKCSKWIDATRAAWSQEPIR